jgi:hypothetical protein
MPITYTIAIDYNHDGDFTDTGDDITAHVLDLQWTLGMTRPYDNLADYSTAQITVRNPIGTFSPERNTLQSGTRVRIQSSDGTTTRTHFTGYVSHVETDAGEWSKKAAVIHLQDIQPWLDASPVVSPIYSDVTADVVIDDLLDRAILRRAVIHGYCIIDVDGYNDIDSVTIFAGDNVPRTLDTGVSEFAYVGDWWQESIPARQAIRDLVSSEQGRFYINRDGEVIFLNRRYTLLTKTISATFSDDMQSIDYTYGDERINRLAVIMTPREIGVSNTGIWQLDHAQLIPVQTRFTLNLRFTDEQNQPIGLLELDDLNPLFHLSTDGAGDPITEGVSVHIMRQGFTSMDVQISNTGQSNVYLTGLTVTGKPLYRRDPLEIVVSDGEGLYVYGVKSARRDLPALSNIEVAQAFATYEVQRRKHPSGTIQTLTAITRDHPAEVLSLTLFDRIRITESQTGQTAQDYFIVRESHHVSKGGTHHTVTWLLEPADSTRFVIIDTSNINDTSQVIVPY